jgi:DNA replication protein DnaC
MHQLGLAGMARAFAELEANPQSANLSHAEWLGLLLDREATERYERRLRARLRYARLRHQAAVEDVDYRAARGLDRSLFQSMIGRRWIDQAQNLIIEGPAGVGKSWLACALGHKVRRDNCSVLYQRTPRMFADLALARGDGRYPRLMRALGGVKLLILDDWGLEPLGPEQRHDMLEIVEDRYGRSATLITSQMPVDRWHDLIGEPTLADAILDRIVHNAHRLQLKGDSLRKQSALRTAATWPPITGYGRDHIGLAGDPHPRPTSIGTAGRLRSEQVADINRNARPASSESAPTGTGRPRTMVGSARDAGRRPDSYPLADPRKRPGEAGCRPSMSDI